jgi:hypothetical protein
LSIAVFGQLSEFWLSVWDGERSASDFGSRLFRGSDFFQDFD